MTKTTVYSWRLSPRLKAELEEAARTQRQSVASLLDGIAEEWLESWRGRGGDEDKRQRRLHEAAMKFVGAIQGGNPDRSTSARSAVRNRIAHRHGR